MTRTKLLGVLLAMLGYSGAAPAIPLIGTPPLTFSEITLSHGTLVEGQYAPRFGVTFSPGLYYDTGQSPQEPPSLANFNSEKVLSDLHFSILFSQVQSAFAFSFQGGRFVTTFSAVLNRETELNVYESIVNDFFTVSDTHIASFYGFTGIPFNEIRISPATGSNLFLLDNLQYARIPESGTLALLGLGFAALFVAKRRAGANRGYPPMHKH